MLTDQQQAEIDKYGLCYRTPGYAMGAARKKSAQAALSSTVPRGAYLDVGCGRGEMLAFASRLGFQEVQGTEVVDSLIGGSVRRALAWDLPFEAGAFDVVSMFDVIEHLLPGDDERACRELARVADCHVLITASNIPSQHHGVDLHVNRRPYAEWDSLFAGWFSAVRPGAVVTWLRPLANPISEVWRVDLP